MHSWNKSYLIKAPAKLVYDVVKDVEKYPEFVPWCKKINIIESYDEHHFAANMIIAFKSMEESYTSDVKSQIINENHFIINVEARPGLFKKLTNKWEIIQIGEYTKINFSINFLFKSKILDMSLSFIFSIATKKMIESFQKRVISLSKASDKLNFF